MPIWKSPISSLDRQPNNPWPRAVGAKHRAIWGQRVVPWAWRLVGLLGNLETTLQWKNPSWHENYCGDGGDGDDDDDDDEEEEEQRGRTTSWHVDISTGSTQMLNMHIKSIKNINENPKMFALRPSRFCCQSCFVHAQIGCHSTWSIKPCCHTFIAHAGQSPRFTHLPHDPNFAQGLVNVPFWGFWTFWTSPSNICWILYPQ